MNPSRTYTLSTYGLVATLALAVLTVLVALVAPDQVTAVGAVFESLSWAIIACAGGGAGALAYRDSASKGLTSSQGQRVLEAMQTGAVKPPSVDSAA